MFLTKKIDSQYTKVHQLFSTEDFKKNIEAKKPLPPSFANYTSGQLI